MEESELLFSLFYVLLCMCLVYPPEEFQRLGLTTEQLFSRFLGIEDLNFIRYHQRRTSLNLLLHSCLPAVYFLIYELKFSVLEKDVVIDSDIPMPQEVFSLTTLTWRLAFRFSLLAALAVPVLLLNWRQQNWQRHPMSQALAKFSNVPHSYTEVATSVADEFRRSDIYKKKLNSVSTVITTENWIIKTTLYNINFAHQSDTAFIVAKTETYNVYQDNADTLQMVSINVKPNRRGVPDFNIRINAIDFRNLEERINRPIVIPSNVQFHRNVIDRFIDVFKEEVAKNPLYKADRIAEKCFACMNAAPNVKINKQCNDIDAAGHPLNAEGRCTNCYCRPMWCVECLARWFAARQNEYDHQMWLEQKCACPMCRAKFCLLDVSLLEKSSPVAAEAETNAT